MTDPQQLDDMQEKELIEALAGLAGRRANTLTTYPSPLVIVFVILFNVCLWKLGMIING